MAYNILYICPNSDIGGAETFLKETYSHRNNRQFKNIYLLFNSGPLEDFLLEQGATVEILKIKPRLSKVKTYYSSYKEIKNIIKKYNISLVHSTMAYSAIFSALATQRMGCPHIWFQHCQAIHGIDLLASVLPHRILLTNSKFALESQNKLDKKIPWLKFKKRKKIIITLGTDTDKPKIIQDENIKTIIDNIPNRSPKSKIISMLCRIHPSKGIDLLMDSIVLLKDINPDLDLHFLIWGEIPKDKSYYLKLSQRAKKNNLPLSFVGPTNQAKEVLALSDLLINTSVTPETFGLTLIEAMSVGTVPLAPKEGGPLGIITDQVNGLLFTPRDPQSLAQNFNHYFSNDSLHSTMKNKAESTVKEHFNIKETIKTLENLYLEILDNRV